MTNATEANVSCDSIAVRVVRDSSTVFLQRPKNIFVVADKIEMFSLGECSVSYGLCAGTIIALIAIIAIGPGKFVWLTFRCRAQMIVKWHFFKIQAVVSY